MVAISDDVVESSWRWYRRIVVEGGRKEMQNAEQTPIVTKTNRFCTKVSFSQSTNEWSLPMPQASLTLVKIFSGDNYLDGSSQGPTDW